MVAVQYRVSYLETDIGDLSVGSRAGFVVWRDVHAGRSVLEDDEPGRYDYKRDREDLFQRHCKAVFERKPFEIEWDKKGALTF